MKSSRTSDLNRVKEETMETNLNILENMEQDLVDRALYLVRFHYLQS